MSLYKQECSIQDEMRVFLLYYEVSLRLARELYMFVSPIVDVHVADSRIDETKGQSRERGTPLYGLYRYVRPQGVWFFSCFGHK